MNKNKVSIIVPIYNAQDYLLQCVESLVNQDYENIEILLIDDGSTDGSPKICDDLASEYSNIRVIHKKNGGTAATRNLGVLEASGEYIMFIDADDWFELNTVNTLMSRVNENNLDVARFGYVREFGDKSLEKKNSFLEERVYEGEDCKELCRQVLGLTGDELSHLENMNFLASVCFAIYRRSLIVDNNLRFVNFFEVGSFVDGLFNFEIFNYVNRFEYLDKPFYHYRKTNALSASNKYRKNFLDKQLLLFEKIRVVISKYDIQEKTRDAYTSRVVFNTMEMCMNATTSSESVFKKYKEIKEIFKNADIKKIRKSFKLRKLPIKFKVYFFFIKHGWAFPVYAMTALVMKMKRKGV